MQAASPRIEAFRKAFGEVAECPSPQVCIPSFTGSSAAFAAVALALRAETPFVLVVTPGLPEADSLLDDLRVLENESPVRAVEFPPALADDRPCMAARIKAAAVLAAWRSRPYPLVMVAPSAALATPVPPAAAVAAALVRLTLGGEAPTFAELQQRLLAAGYERVDEVVEAGAFSVRGGVIDAWSPDATRPVRAEYFGDELESLREFDPALQTSVARIGSAEFQPVRIEGEDSGGTLLFEVLPSNGAVVFVEHNEYSTLLPREFPLRVVYSGDPAPRGVPTAAFQASPLPGFRGLGTEVARNPELLEAARNRLRAHLASARRRGSLVIEEDELSGGFEIEGLVICSKSDRVFAHRRKVVHGGFRGVGAGERLSSDSDLEPGELVVHVDHGIGRFEGSTEIEVAGQRIEVLTIEYAEGAKLHVPVSHVHLLSRYMGVKGAEVKLHRLDGKRWNREKEAARRSVEDLAAALLETQARRSVVPGFAYEVESSDIAAFEMAFPYEVTPDQARAIADVKTDMSSTRPMDRLVCGDAGYGKTEVAMRAAFIAALNGKQTALLAPTTVLAEQHYETFLSRFDGTPVRIEVMSRFQNKDAMRDIRSRLLSGATDIVIGTHAILSQKVVFHDLGLIVIDEEQRFGVRHKEHLKRLRSTADVLTMSATPIPRTLYMSMTGARDLSLLRTPPRERVAVETTIVRNTDSTVRDMIRRELARSGQVFFLHNRVLTIERTAARLRELVPEAIIETAHGQMPASELAARMQRFSSGEANVLLCTTIVESGLDIPRANTILVDRADCFGIAELYQLRGRVGRSSRQGYACFLLPEEGSIDSEARERLDALRKHAGLGAGFNIAMRDLEIRGAGNLLGREQSGHIAAVGFRLYCRLLQRTVARLKGEDVPEVTEVTFNFDFLDYSPGSHDVDDDCACLPYDYVEDEAQRADFHRRLAEAVTLPKVKKLKAELSDRYGRLPRPAVRLVKLAELRALCASIAITRIDVKGDRAVFYRSGSHEIAFVRHLESTVADRRLAQLSAEIQQLVDKVKAG